MTEQQTESLNNKYRQLLKKPAAESQEDKKVGLTQLKGSSSPIDTREHIQIGSDG